MQYKVFWTQNYNAIVDADSVEEAKQKVYNNETENEDYEIGDIEAIKE